MSDEQLANRFLAEAALVGMCQNLEIDTEAPIATQIQAPSLFDGPSILANVSARVDFAGNEIEPARFVTTQSYDPESAAIAVMSAMRKLVGDKAADDAMKDGKLPTIRYDETTTCHVDTTSGETVKVISDLDTFADGKGKRDTRTITLVRQ